MGLHMTDEMTFTTFYTFTQKINVYVKLICWTFLSIIDMLRFLHMNRNHAKICDITGYNHVHLLIYYAPQRRGLRSQNI